MSIIKNMTTHSINYYSENDKVIVFPPHTPTPRCAEVISIAPQIEYNGNIFKCIRKTLGEPIDLPVEEKDTLYIVSLIVFQACPLRKDFICIGESVRDTKGNVIGCKSFSVRTFMKVAINIGYSSFWCSDLAQDYERITGKSPYDIEVKRNDPDLIKLLETNNYNANSARNYKIIEIPDNIEYNIHSDPEYGGYESIHEAHYRWD